MRRLGSLSDEYRYYNHYMDVYYYLNDLEEKEIFTEEDYQGIKEIYSLATSTGGITRVKYLFKLVPSEGFNNMSSKISEISRQTR